MSPLNRKVLFNFPNILTFSRIAVIPIIMILMSLDTPSHSYDWNKNICLWAAFLFILAGISDLVDGYYARKYGMVSLMGKFIDPMADKLIHMSVMVMLVSMNRFPGWLAALLIFREILITGLRSIAVGEGIIIAAGEWGKKKTAWFNVGLGALIIHYPFFGFSSYTVGWSALFFGSIYSIFSGLQYLVVFFREAKNDND